MKTLTTPSAATLDYTNVDEICSYQLLLCKLYERAGGFSYQHKTTPEIAEIRKQGSIWLRHVRPILNNIGENDDNSDNNENVDNAIPLSAIPDLLESYIILHLICRSWNDIDYYRKVRLVTVSRWVAGDKSITGTGIVTLLWPLIESNPLAVERRYIDFCTRSLQQWIKQLSAYGTFTDITPVETYRRLQYIISHDLYAYIPGGKLAEGTKKAEWAATHEVTLLQDLDTPTLLAYLPFATTATLRGYFKIPDTLSRLHNELAGRSDLHPYYRAALEMELAKFPGYAG